MSGQDVLIPEDRAAALLKMPKRQVRKLAQLDILQHVAIGRDWRYSLQQVQTLAQIKSRALLSDIAIPERVEQLAVEVSLLQRTIRHLALATGMTSAFWTPTDEQLRGLYLMANSRLHFYSADKKPSPAKVNDWLTSISQLGVKEFRRLRRWFSEDPHPWRPFWIVTEEMIAVLGFQRSREAEIEAAVLRHRLALCLDSLRHGVLAYCAIESPYVDFRQTMEQARSEFGGTIGDLELRQFLASDGLNHNADTATDNLISDTETQELPDPIH